MNIAFKIGGLLVATIPITTGVSKHLSDPMNIPGGIANEYGYNVVNNSMDYGKAFAAAAVTVVGILIMKAGGLISRSV